MQSTEGKSKQSRKSTEESTAKPQSPVTAAEETSKPRRKPAAKKAIADSTSAAKQHRGAAKKTVVSVPGVDETLATATRPHITHADIASLAYSFWAERGYQGGSAEEDWFRAEKQLSSGQ
jgi:hypothetical protein